MTKSITKPIVDMDRQVLTEIELNALREEFGVSKTHYDIHDLILADISLDMLKAILQADSISITVKKGPKELHFPLHLANNGYQHCLQGQPAPDSNILINQHKLHKFQ